MELFRHIAASSTLAIIIFGCMGNLLSIVIFLNHRTSSINILLAALSSVDLCLLLFAVPVFVLPNFDSWNGIYSTHFQAFLVKFVYPINLMFQTASIYIIVLITIERWLAICRPFQVRVWCTPRTAKRSLVVVFALSFAYNFVRFWEYSLGVVFEPNSTTEVEAYFQRNFRDFDTHPGYVVWYYSVLYLITHFLLPFCFIISLNGHVSKTIIHCHRAREQLTKRQRREHNTTTMLVVVTLLFAICNTLPFLLNFGECLKRDLFESPTTAPIAYYLNDIANLLVILNSSVTWIFYIIFSAKYRQSAAKIIRLNMPKVETENGRSSRKSFVSKDKSSNSMTSRHDNK